MKKSILFMPILALITGCPSKLNLMKKISLLIVFFAFVGTKSSTAQESSNEWKHWSVGASYFVSDSWNNNPNNEGHPLKDIYSHFQGININIGYKLKLYKSFMFHPDLSLFYFKQEPETHRNWIGGTLGNKMNLKGVGMNIALPFGFYFPTKKLNFDLETGPVINLLFNDVYQDFRVSEELTEAVFRDKKFNASWRFGARIALKMGLFVNVSYDIRMTKFMWHYNNHGNEVVIKPGVLSVGLGYEF